MNNFLEQKQQEEAAKKKAETGFQMTTAQMIGGAVLGLLLAFYFVGLKALFLVIPGFIVMALLDAEKQMSKEEKRD
jgi:uncharacterized membrane protein YoaK (UPF0700 family)